MRLLISFIFTLFCLCPAQSQEAEAKEVLFKVFVKDNDGTRIDLTANENYESKITGFFSHKAKYILKGTNADRNISQHNDIFIEILDTVKLRPNFFRLMNLKVKKRNREMVCWSNSMVVGPKDHSKDFIPTVIYPVDGNIYRISIKDLTAGNYLIMYQEGLSILILFYDFDK